MFWSSPWNGILMTMPFLADLLTVFHYLFKSRRNDCSKMINVLSIVCILLVSGSLFSHHHDVCIGRINICALLCWIWRVHFVSYYLWYIPTWRRHRYAIVVFMGNIWLHHSLSTLGTLFSPSSVECCWHDRSEREGFWAAIRKLVLWLPHRTSSGAFSDRLVYHQATVHLPSNSGHWFTRGRRWRK